MIKERRNMNDRERRNMNGRGYWVKQDPVYKGTAWIYDDIEIDIDDLMKGKRLCCYKGWEEYFPIVERLLTLPDKRDFTSLLKVDETDEGVVLYGTTLNGVQIVGEAIAAGDLGLELLLSIVNARYVNSLDRFKSGVMDSLFHRKPRMRMNDDIDDEFLHVYDQGYNFGLNLDISIDDNVKRDISKELHDLDIYNIVPALHTEPTFESCEWGDDEE